MTNLIDYILDLFRSPDVAANFVRDPNGAMRDAGLPNVSAAQLQAVATTAAPAGVALGGGDPVQGLQHAVANYHSMASPFSPQTSFAPQTDIASNNSTDFASHNATQVASNNDFLSPDQHSGANSQQGGVNIGFGDITFGDKTNNTATDGGVVNTGNAGDIDTTSVNGDGNVVGDDNNANTGVIHGGSHSPVIIGEDNDTEVKDSSQHSGGGDIISGNEGPVIKDVDMSGGHGGNANASGGGGLLGIGNGGNEANAGGGGGGGSIILTDSHNTNTHGGDVTNVDTHGGDISGGVDASHDDNSIDNSDNSTHDSHNDNSTHDSHDATVETHVDVSNDVGLF